ncbi:ATP-binding cassette domain-containing protein [Methylobacterium radiotolerans]|uniref:ATP-binding cassette domain-containing protein n=1 Tax=Methylobacterium radiotolerans TaxID=31998 RepID=UPI0024573193|nr:ATP-binding cassette domain-containing protein [Methylobacterium radiotolerans]
MVGGYAGQLSLGQGIFYGLGASCGMLLVGAGISPWIGIVAGAALAVLVALAISFPCFRLHGPSFSLATIAFLEVFRVLAARSSPMLTLERVDASYGATSILHAASLEVRAGEVVTIVGANGAGKTTTLRTIAGFVTPTRGRILFEDEDVTRLSGHEMVARGVTLIPEGRQLFPEMTVRENLLTGAYRRAARERQSETLADVLDLFPRVRERLDQNAGSLSGGEQQMVAIARGMMARPKLLMFDEPSLGLAPIVVAQVFAVVDRIARTGATVLIVEQNVFHTLQVADRGYVLENGEIVLADASAALLDNDHVRRTYLGI